MTADSDREAPTLFFQAIEPPPTACPIGATAEDTEIAASVSTDQGLVVVRLPLAFAKHLAFQLQDAARDAQDLNRPLRQS